MNSQQDNITDLQKEIAWAKEELAQAKDELQNWKPVAFHYEYKIESMIDKKYPIPETTLIEFDLQGFTVTRIMRHLNIDSLDDLVEKFFQEHYDEITGDDANELASNVADAERRLAQLEDDLVNALDSMNKTED